MDAFHDLGNSMGAKDGEVEHRHYPRVVLDPHQCLSKMTCAVTVGWSGLCSRCQLGMVRVDQNGLFGFSGVPSGCEFDMYHPIIEPTPDVVHFMGCTVSTAGLEALVVLEAKRSPQFGMVSHGHIRHQELLMPVVNVQ